MIVSVPGQAKRRYPVDAQSFTDITAKQVTRTGWVEQADGTETYDVQFAVNLTADEADAVQRRLSTASTVEEQLQQRAWAATQNLLDYEASTSPTNATTVAVVKLLCKVVRALIRLQLRQLDTLGDPASTTTVTQQAAVAQANKAK